MNKNSIDLLCYLESQLVFKSGMIHQDNITASDRKQIELWEDQGFLEITKIPPPDRHSGPVMFTHRIRFSEKAWELAHKARRKKAQQHSPTLKSDDETGLKLVKNGQEDRPADSRFTSDYSTLPSLEGFEDWLEANGAELTLPQQKSAKMFFESMKMDNIKFFWRKRETGKSWLLKSIDQYITQLQH